MITEWDWPAKSIWSSSFGWDSVGKLPNSCFGDMGFRFSPCLVYSSHDCALEVKLLRIHGNHTKFPGLACLLGRGEFDE